jgi:exodeoxyribonuclease V alpha subunit
MATIRELGDFLKANGLSPIHAGRVWSKFRPDPVAALRENPYLVCRERIVSFAQADSFAECLRFDMSSIERVKGAVVGMLDEASRNGHVYMPHAALGVGLHRWAAQLDDAIDGLMDEGEVATSAGRVYLHELYRDEVDLAGHLRAQLARGFDAIPPPTDDVLKGLTETQRTAVRATASHGVVVITGGPGVGKTTIVNAIAHTWRAAGKQVALAAPTGRAAKRMAEATGQPASTIHRLLEYQPSPQAGEWIFARNADNQLTEYDCFIIDEASMMDVSLAAAFLRAVPSDAALVLVGDVNQLPSVGPGQVLADIIGSGTAPVFRLTEVFRQARDSGIVRAAYDILGGRVPIGARGAGADFYTPFAAVGATAQATIHSLTTDVLVKQFGFKLDDVQVLTPMHKGAAGTQALNLALQEALNPNGEMIFRRWEKAPLRVGDRVVQKRNDYERQVFNGEVGRVAGKEGERTFVEYDGREVRYDARGIQDVELAYAMTIHASQGAQWPAVLVALLPEHARMLKRNLIYTAVTRAQKLAMVVGTPGALHAAVTNNEIERRNTALRERLTGE